MASEIAERNRRIVERFLTEGVLAGRLDVFDELCDPASSTMPQRRRPARASTLSSASSVSLVQPCRISGGAIGS